MARTRFVTRRFRDDFYLKAVRRKDPDVEELDCQGDDYFIRNNNDEEWEEIGRDISNNTYLKKLTLEDGALNDHKISFFFRGLTGSSSIEELHLNKNGLSAVGVRSMVPFLQNANNLITLHLDTNSLQSEGLNTLFRTLSDSLIENISCKECGIESIEIDIDCLPRKLHSLDISCNNIGVDGCRGIAQLLQARDSTLGDLRLQNSNIDDEGVAVLADALRSNTSLDFLHLGENDGITKEGQTLLLKLVNDISSVEATLQSNHSLRYISFDGHCDDHFLDDKELFGVRLDWTDITKQINSSTLINENCNPETIGREKLIATQLHSDTRAMLAKSQDINRSFYSGINPLHLPEVLSLVGRRHGQGELYVALKSSIAEVISTVDRKRRIKEEMAYYAGKLEELGAELAEIEAAECNAAKAESEYDRIKRRRV